VSRRQWVLAVLAALGTMALAALLPAPARGPSTYGRASGGLLSAYAYLEARGVEVHRWERPLSELPAAQGTLVLSPPFQVGWTDEDTRALHTWTGQGGTVLLLASGVAPDAEEQALLSGLHLSAVSRRTEAPLWWSEWKVWRAAPAQLRAEQGLPDGLVQRAETHGIAGPAGAVPLLRDEQDRVLAFRLPQARGPLLVFDNGTALENELLAQGGNLALLEQLLVEGGPAWFDELHHGHLEGGEAELATVAGPFEALLAHMALIYLLVVWTLSRRHGPTLARLQPPQGSVSRDLLALATLHRQGGHAAPAGRLLVELARARARRGGHHADLPEAFDGDESAFVALARRIGLLQREGRL